MNGIKFLLFFAFIFFSYNNLVFAQSNIIFSDKFNETTLSSTWQRWQSSSDTAYVENGVLNIKTNIGWQVVQVPLPELPQGEYIVKYSARTNSKSRLRVLVEEITHNKIVSDKLTPASELWIHQVQRFKVEQNQKGLFLRIFPQDRFAQNGLVSIDDIVVEKVTPRAPTSAKYILEERFDSNQLGENWQRWQSTTETAYIENSTLAIETNQYWQVVQSKLNTADSGQYEIFFNAKTNPNTRMRVLIENLQNKEIISDLIVPSNQPWGSHTMHFDIEQPEESLYFRVFPLDRENENGKVFIDNIRVIKKENIIKNSGFDKNQFDISPWKRWQSNITTAHAAGNVLNIKTNHSWQVVEQKIDYPETKAQYQVSFLAKTNDKSRLRASIYDFTDDKTLSSISVSKGIDWARYKIYFTTPEKLGNNISLRFYPLDRAAIEGAVYIDNVKISEVKNINISRDVRYNLSENTFSFNGVDIENINEHAFSSDGTKFIYTKSVKGKSLELFEVDSNNKTKERLTFSDSLIFSPAINNYGDIAYLESEHSVSRAKVILNGKEVATNYSGLNRFLNLNEENLYFTNTNYQENRNKLITYNLNNQSTSEFLLPGIPQKMQIFNSDYLIIQVHHNDANKLMVYSFNLNNHDLQLISDDKLTSFFKINNNKLTIEQLIGENELKLLYFSLYTYKNWQLSEPYATGDNKLGRLSWNQSYRLKGLVDLYRITGSEYFLDQIEFSLNSLLLSSNKYQDFVEKEQAPNLWSTTKYSIDKSSPVNLLIDDATILHALMYAIRYAPVEPTLKHKVLDIAKSSYEYYDREFDGLNYRIAYGIPFSLDGLWAPNNFQLEYGLVLLYLYEMTNNAGYLNRLKTITNRFVNEITITPDQRMLWQYWPAPFYQGWTESDKISKNLPNRPATENHLYEDIAHAAINVNFLIKIIEHTDLIDEKDEYITYLNNTIDAFSFNGKFSRFISGDVDYQPASFEFIPLDGWAQLKNKNIVDPYLNYIPMFYPSFDSMSRISDYLNAISIEALKKPQTLEVSKHVYNENLTLQVEEKVILHNVHDILREFELH